MVTAENDGGVIMGDNRPKVGRMLRAGRRVKLQSLNTDMKVYKATIFQFGRTRSRILRRTFRTASESERYSKDVASRFNRWLVKGLLEEDK